MVTSAGSGFRPSGPTLRRAAAIVTLGGAYQCAATGFELPWVILTLIGVLAVAWGAPYRDAETQAPALLPWPVTGTWLIALLPGWLLGLVAGICKLTACSPRVVINLWLAALAWLVIGAWLASRGTRSSASPRVSWAWGWGLLVIGVGAVLRVWHLGSLPSFVHGDEEVNLHFALAFYANPNRDWFTPMYSLMPLYFAINGIGTFLFGFSVVGARAADALLGIASLALLFYGLRQVATRRLTVVGTLLTAVNHAHIAFSRVGTGNIQTTCAVAAVFAIFSRVWTAPTYLNATLLGVAVVIGLQTYQASYATLPLLIAVIVVLGLLNPARRRTLVVPACLLSLTVATLGTPVFVAFGQHREELSARARIVSLLYPENFGLMKQLTYHTDSSVKAVAQQAWLALLGFQRGHDHETQYRVDAPMADPYTAALMIPGALLALLGLRSFVAANSLIFTVGYLLFGLGIAAPPGFNRATGALALGPVLAAIALVHCANAFSDAGALARRLRDLFLAAVVALVLSANAHIYLSHERSYSDINSTVGRLALRYAKQYQVHLVSWPLGVAGNDGLRLLISPASIEQHRERDPVAYVEHARVTGQDLFIIQAAQIAARDALLRRFPGARVEPWPASRSREPILFLVFVDHGKP